MTTATRIAMVALMLGAPAAVSAEDLRTAVVAGGCFWCVEADFDKVEGVTETVSGFAGGTVDNPSYRQVVAGGTGHREAVRITYDAEVLPYAALLDKFLRSIDPTDDGGQFCDRGDSYTTAIFPGNADEAAEAEAAVAEAEKALGRTVVTAIVPDAAFWPAEDYHQNFYKKNPVRYTTYRRGCRRDATVDALWGERALHNQGS